MITIVMSIIILLTKKVQYNLWNLLFEHKTNVFLGTGSIDATDTNKFENEK